MEKLSLKPALSSNPERAGLSIVQLNIPEIGALQFDNGVEDLIQHRWQVSGRDQPRAQLVQPRHGRQFISSKS